MSPLEVIDTYDSIAHLIQFRTSAVYEMILSLQSLVQPRRNVEWVKSTRTALGADFVQSLTEIYEPFQAGSAFVELGVDYPDHDDVPGFIRYVAEMDAELFIFYTLGRLFTREQILQTGFKIAAMQQLTETLENYDHLCYQGSLEWVEDVPAVQKHLTEVWRWYWEAYFCEFVQTLRPHWNSSLAEKERFFAREGGQALYEHLTGKTDLPAPLPPDHPIERIEIIPLYLHPKRVYVYYGYGSVAVLYDSQRSETRLAEIEQGKNAALLALRALGDDTRLKILQLIAHGEKKINGKKIAEQLSMSPSAVSRHLTQLKEAGIILEESLDNRNITYQLQADVLTKLPETLMDYFYS